MEFKNLEELYIRITPALTSRIEELKTESIIVTEQEIFEFLKNTKWVFSKDLNLSEMVSDILKCNKNDLIRYIENK